MPTTNAASNYLEDKMRGHLLRGVSFTPSGILAIGLTSGVPSDTSTGASCTELQNTGSYARVSVTSNTTNWSADDTTNNIAYNNNAITFTTPSADWGWTSGLIIADTAVYGAGNIYFYGALTSAQFIQNGNTVSIPVSGLSIQFL